MLSMILSMRDFYKDRVQHLLVVAIMRVVLVEYK